MGSILPDIPQSKQCPHCKQVKLLTDFHRSKRNPDGHHSWCKVCRTKPKVESFVPEGMKQCAKCKECFPATPEYFFRIAKGRDDKLVPRCKACCAKPKKQKDDIPTGHKRCPRCLQVFPATTEYFHVRIDRSSGIRAECITCGRTRARNFARQHSERHRLNAIRYRQENPEKVREGWKQYRQTHYQQRMAYKRQYRETHRTEILTYARQYGIEHAEQRRQWRRNNLHKLRAYRHKYRALKRDNGGTLTGQDIQRQYRRQRGKCYYCHKKLTRYHADHVVPLSRGGTNDPSNIVVACPRCNQSKQARLPHEWPEGGRLL